MSVNLHSFRARVAIHKTRIRRFISRIAKNPPSHFHRLAVAADQETWQETDCLTCANCCKTMSPTYTRGDVKRIAEYLNMTPEAFREKWLRKDRSGDIMNKTEPCQFLNLKDNKCSIYPVRPADCAGFPHHTKRKFSDYDHVFKQNIEYCPATYRWIEKIREKVEAEVKKG